MSKNERVFDFSRVSDENLEARLKEARLEVKKLQRKLNGPPVECGAEACGRVEADRDRLRLGHDSEGVELVLCGECGFALFRRGVVTAPYGKVLRSDLERAEAFASAAKEELARRAKLAAERAEHERKLEASGFFDRFKKREEPVAESGNGADHPEPIQAEPAEMESLPEGQTTH